MTLLPDTRESLAQRVAVITGAAAGIGAETAQVFAACGATLALCDRNASETFQEGTSKDDGQLLLRRLLDVRDRDAVGRFVADVIGAFGHVDLLVNNAGGTFASSFLDVSEKGEAALIAENFTQVTHFIRQTVPVMRDGGAIVNVTSIEAHRAAPDFAVYSAMKAGLENLTTTLALEFAPRSIRVNTVAPDAIFTGGEPGMREGPRYRPSPMPPLGRIGQPIDAAAAIWFLCSDLSRFITGTTIHVDGGNYAAGGWHRQR